MVNLLLILSANFIVGALIMFLFINRKKQYSCSGNKYKYFFYLIIVSMVISLIVLFEKAIPYLFAFIILLGLAEIVTVTRRNYPLRFLAIFYLIITGSFFVLFGTLNGQMILEVYILVVIFDGNCQVWGQLFGKHKLVGKISPGKTIEGLAGGVIFTILSAIAFGYRTVDDFIFLLIIIISALSGDLFASVIKRRAAVKDFSKLIPGHGGILDRFDSLVFTGSVIYLISVYHENF